MKIDSIKIKNFRSIKNAFIRMHNITAIVGENNAGKTAILKALNAVLNFHEEESSFKTLAHRFAPKTNSYIEVTFDDVPNSYRQYAANGKMTIYFCYKYSTCKRIIHVIDTNTNQEKFIDDDFMNELSEKIMYVYIPADRTTGDVIWERDSIFKRLVTNYIAQHTINRDRISTHVRTATAKIHSIALKNLEKEINGLYMQDKNVDFKVTFPLDIDYRVLLNNVTLSLTEHGNSYPIQEWGSGTRSLAIIALYRAHALLRKSNIVLGIEEPEINLHPQAQKRFINSLRDKRHDNETQSIFTTHSTVLVDLLKHDEIVLVRRKNDDKRGFISDIWQLPDDFWQKYELNEFKHYQYFTYRNSDFFFSKFIIVGESKNDCQIFETLLTPSIGAKSSDISYIDAGGTSSIPYPYFLLKELKIPFVLIVDRDYFFDYYNNNTLDNSRDKHTGLPVYSKVLKHNSVLDDLFSTEAVRTTIENSHIGGYRTFFNQIKGYRILSMNYCLEMDLTCSRKAREQYYNLLHIPAGNQSQKTLLINNKKSIKDIEKITAVLKNIPNNALPESFKKIKNHLIELVNEYVKA